MTKRKIQILLLSVSVVVLLATCLISIFAPVCRDNERNSRETIVKQRLCIIRSAQEHYRNTHGCYAADFKQLITAKLIADSIQYVPFAEGAKFRMAATKVEGKSGKMIPVMECSALYADFLKGMNEKYISSIIENANIYGEYPGLKFGDITSNNDNAANWE